MSSDLFGTMPQTQNQYFAIRVNNVSKRYVMFERPEDRFKQMVVPRLQRLVGRPGRRYFRDFAALNGVTFEIGRGETVGIIGRNGSGKSTLLQIICGTLQPTSGSVEVNGRIAALLELGAGFNPEFTGRENVFLNAQILGVPRQEMEWRFDEIARFADIGPFLDQPVKSYSSGMYVRLAFATAINVDPDILVVDEALSVGDEAFQRKCFARIEDIKDKGGTILFVSHGAQSIVQLCTRAVLIDGGEKILEGAPKPVVGQYQRLVNLSGEQAVKVRREIVDMGTVDLADGDDRSNTKSEPNPTQALEKKNGYPASPEDDDSWFDPGLVPDTTVSYEEDGGRISDIRFETLSGNRVNVLNQYRRYVVAYRFEALTELKNVSFGTLFKTIQGLELCGGNTNRDPEFRLKHMRAGEVMEIRFEFDCLLRPGVYFTNVGAVATVADDRRFVHRILDALACRVVGNPAELDYGYFSLGMKFDFKPMKLETV